MPGKNSPGNNKEQKIGRNIFDINKRKYQYNHKLQSMKHDWICGPKGQNLSQDLIQKNK